MKGVEKTPLTLEEYRLLPETGPRYQLIEGELFMAPAPNRYHQTISGNLFLIIGNYLEKHPLGKLYHAPFDVFLDEINAFQPDLLFVAGENRILTTAGAEGAPDFVVEILSPTTADLDLNPKRRVYARSGAKELWLVDPEAKRIDVYDLQKDPERPVATHSGQSTFSSPLFPGLKFKGPRIFRE